MRISDWSSDVCSSDLRPEQSKNHRRRTVYGTLEAAVLLEPGRPARGAKTLDDKEVAPCEGGRAATSAKSVVRQVGAAALPLEVGTVALGVDGHFHCSQEDRPLRSEEHTSELQSPMRISYAVFCLTKKTNDRQKTQ